MAALTSLSASNQIVTLNDGRNGVLLNRSGNIVSSKLNVLQHDRMKAGIGECLDWLDANSTLLLNLDLVYTAMC